jgi:hypothetical protein
MHKLSVSVVLRTSAKANSTLICLSQPYSIIRTKHRSSYIVHEEEHNFIFFWAAFTRKKELIFFL